MSKNIKIFCFTVCALWSSESSVMWWVRPDCNHDRMCL